MKKTNVIAGILLLAIGVVIMLWKVFICEPPQFRMVKKMGAGINIGNSLDSYGLRGYSAGASDLEFETFWGNPQITQELFVMIKNAGFSTVRIPVTWQDHMDEKGKVSEEWMDRVQEVVDMALDRGLYVILNTHHEEWMDLQTDKKDEISEKFANLWLQIAERFAEYDEKLVFEGMNEPRLRDSEYEWTAGNRQLRDMVNCLNKVFVDTVRGTGGMNDERFLMICPYASGYEKEAMADMDVMEGNIIVSIHMYYPYTFCQKEDGIEKWDMAEGECVGYADDIAGYFDNMRTLFLKKGIPVMITEFGCMDKGNTDSRINWIKTYKEEAEKYGIPCIWWDDGSNYQIMDRELCEWTCPEIKDILVK